MSPRVETPHQWAARVIRAICYRPDGREPIPGLLARDIRALLFRVTVHQESRDRVEAALHGSPLVWPKLRGVKWSPAKCWSKAGPWANLYERAVTEAGKVRRVKPETALPFRRILEEMAR